MDFIEKLAPFAIKYMKLEGILASLTLAQAILESDSGKSELAIKANNIFGIKANSTWKGAIYPKKTKEFSGGKWIEIVASFCEFSSLEECIEYRSKVFLKRAHYNPLWGVTDYKEACRIIWQCGYATDPNYPQKLIDVIEKNKLYEFDKELKDMPNWVQDAGHGGSDPGATAKGNTEKVYTLEAALYINKRLIDHGIESECTRYKDETLDETPRVKKVKNFKKCNSHHFNAGGGSGVEVIVSQHSDKKYAQMVIDEFKAADYPVRPTPVFAKKNSSGGDYYYMHRRTGNCQTAIVEYDFVDGPQSEKIKDKAYREGMYECVVRAICRYEGVKYISLAKEVVSVGEQKLTEGQEKIRQEAIRLGITDGKNPFREVHQFYAWAVTVPLAQRIEELERKLK